MPTTANIIIIMHSKKICLHRLMTRNVRWCGRVIDIDAPLSITIKTIEDDDTIKRSDMSSNRTCVNFVFNGDTFIKQVVALC